MNFTSLEFLLFFPIVVLLFWHLPPAVRGGLLLTASYGFYLCAGISSLLTLFMMTVISYVTALKIQKETSERKKKWLVFLTTGISLLFMFYVKYSKKLLPAGISFYTFQVISYIIDVYGRKIPAEKNLGDYALYVSFFPQLVAGPIERCENLLPQLKKIRIQKKCQEEQMEYYQGMERILRGFLKKIVLADFFGQFADRVYEAPGNAKGIAVLFGTFCFALQIYCDFSGYSDIALGSAGMFGIRLGENFNSPYLAESVREFWHRWHISLTKWFTDYVYKPLGGKRKGNTRQYLNIMIVFLCSGLWHGVAGHYVIWGALHGMYLVIETLMEKRAWKKQKNKLGKFCNRARTFFLVCFAWIFFRAKSVQDGLGLLYNLSQGWTFHEIKEAVIFLEISVTDICQAVLGVGCMIKMNQKRMLLLYRHKILCCYFLLMSILVAWLGLLDKEGGNAFLYFQF